MDVDAAALSSTAATAGIDITAYDDEQVGLDDVEEGPKKQQPDPTAPIYNLPSHQVVIRLWDGNYVHANSSVDGPEASSRCSAPLSST